MFSGFLDSLRETRSPARERDLRLKNIRHIRLRPNEFSAQLVFDRKSTHSLSVKTRFYVGAQIRAVVFLV